MYSLILLFKNVKIILYLGISKNLTEIILESQIHANEISIHSLRNFGPNLQKNHPNLLTTTYPLTICDG